MIFQRNRSLTCACLAALLLGAFSLDFHHGIALGQSHQLFHPIYRTRQTLAIALSRMHPPYAHGYLAFGSVVVALNEDGFADDGPMIRDELWEKTLTNGAALNQRLKEIQAAPINPALPADIIRGQELGYADFMWGAFRIFGLRIESLYYLYFLILGTSCLLYALEFRREPFLLHVLLVYLALIYFLMDYARAHGLQLNSVANSRLFSALSLPAAAHIFLVLWRGRPPRPATVAMVAAQCGILAFLITCRYEAMWQVMMIVATAIGLGVRSICLRRVVLRPLWPAGLLVLLVGAGNLHINLSADRRYAGETKTHTFWHAVVIGLLDSSPELRREYLGDGRTTGYADAVAYYAVVRDLNQRHDASSPLASVDQGRITITYYNIGYRYYEQLLRSLACRIVLRHPLDVVRGLWQKDRDQVKRYSSQNALAWRSFRVPAALIALGAGVLLLAGGITGGWRSARDGAVVLGIFLLFASVTTTIFPSELAVGSLLCYLGAVPIIAIGGVAILIGRMRR